MGKSHDAKHVNEVMNSEISSGTTVATQAEVLKNFDISAQMPFIEADAYIGDPYALLGQVIQIRKKDGQCPVNASDPGFPVEWTLFPIKHIVNEKSKIQKPVLRGSIVVNQDLAASMNILNYFSGEFKADITFSVLVVDEAAGVIDLTDSQWRNNVEQWKKENTDLMNDDDICFLFVITGFIQKNIIRKKFRKYTGDVKGGAFGINIGGELSTSSDEFSLDTRFGLTSYNLRRPTERVTRSLKSTRGSGRSKSKKLDEQVFQLLNNTKIKRSKNVKPAKPSKKRK